MVANVTQSFGKRCEYVKHVAEVSRDARVTGARGLPFWANSVWLAKTFDEFRYGGIRFIAATGSDPALGVPRRLRVWARSVA